MGVRLVVQSAEGKPPAEELAYGFDQARIVIGRGTGADVRIPHLTVSEVHATLRLAEDGYTLVDNDSTNGTRINGKSVRAQSTVRTGDEVTFGTLNATIVAFGTDRN